MSELTVGTLSGLAANSYVIDVASGSQLTQPGMVLQVVSTAKTDTFSTSSTSFTDVTGLSVSITPSSVASKVLVFLQLKSSQSGADQIFSQMLRDSTPINVGDSAGSRRQSLTMTLTNYTNDDFQVHDNNGVFLDSPATTSAITYKVQLAVAGGTGYVNRSANDVDSNGSSRLASTITVMEVAG